MYTYIYMYIHICVYMHILYIIIHIYIYMYICIHIHTHVYIYIYIYTRCTLLLREAVGQGAHEGHRGPEGGGLLYHIVIVINVNSNGNSPGLPRSLKSGGPRFDCGWLLD